MANPTRLSTVLDTSLYEFDVLRLKVGRTEQALDSECEQDASDMGISQAELETIYGTDNRLKRMSLLSMSQSPNSYRTPPERPVETLPQTHQCHDLAWKAPSSPVVRPLERTPLSVAAFGFIDATAGSSSTPSTKSISTCPSIKEDYLQPRKRRPSLKSLPRKLSSIKQALGRLPRPSRPEDFTGQDYSPSCELCPLEQEFDTVLFRLPCQHFYCTHRVRQIIASTSQDEYGQSSSRAHCCGQEIPKQIVYAATGKPEIESLNQSRISLPLSENVLSNTNSQEDNSLQQNLDFAMTFSDFRLLRLQQEAERDRYMVFYKAQSAALADLHDSAFDELFDQQIEETDALRDTLSEEFSKLEEKHLAAEIEMQESHEHESKMVDLALKHMEGYFQPDLAPTSSSSSSSTSSTTSSLSLFENIESQQQYQHKPTDRDRLELTRQRWLRENLDRKQQSAINVMRGRQATALRTRREKFRDRLTQLETAHEAAQTELEETLDAEDVQFEKTFGERKSRMVKRWNINSAILAKKWSEIGVEMPGPVSDLEWPQNGLEACR